MPLDAEVAEKTHIIMYITIETESNMIADKLPFGPTSIGL